MSRKLLRRDFVKGTAAVGVGVWTGVAARESKAANEQIKIAQEGERRGMAEETLAANYPNATPQEMAQLQNAIDSAQTFEKGLEAAATVRGVQKADAKSAVMSDRALILVDNILGNDELNDVLGSIQYETSHLRSQ